MKSPRPYQIKQIDEASVLLSQKKRIIVQSPTGTGKSYMMYLIIQRALTKGKTILVLTEALKIFQQLHKEFNGIKIDSGVKELYVHKNKCYVAMSQTLVNRDQIISQFVSLDENLLILIDECHIGTMNKLIEFIPNALRIGFSATPAYKWGKHLPKLYNDISVGLQVQDHIDLGSLSSFRYFARIKKGIENLKIKNGEFTEKSQEEAFGTKEVYEGVFEDLLKIKFKKCVIFVSSINHCEEMFKKLVDFGFKATRYHSKLKNSSFELSKFTTLNECNIVVSVSSLTKGWDYPEIDLIILNRSTTSMPLDLQMLGRGSRPLPNKKYFTIIDYGKNYERHGLFNEDRDWKKLWNGVEKKRSGGVAPVKVCSNCGYMCHSSATECPECNHVFVKKEKTKKETELIELTENFSKLRGRKISTLTAYELASYVKFTNRKPYGKRIAIAKGESFLHEYASAMSWNYGWWNHIVADDKVEFADIVIR